MTKPGPKGKILTMPRPAQHPTPCHICPKTEGQKERTRANAVTMSDKNQQALQHYLECKSTGIFPDDPIVKRNASYIAPFAAAAEQMMPMLAMLKNRQTDNG